jgi:L-asparaginase
MIMKKILLITTGGTIASRKDSDTGYIKSGVIDGNFLAGLVPSWSGLSFEVLDLYRLPSAHLRFEHLKEITDLIKNRLSDDIYGVVVTHGTDTLEETAYFLSLTLAGIGPVVITGSQKPPEDVSSDALSNLLDSLYVASSEQSKNKGVVVVFNSKIFAGPEVIKTHTSNLDAFAAPGLGPIGYLDNGKVVYKREANKPRLIPIGNEGFKPVYIAKFGMAMDGKIIEVLLKAGAKGIILEGYGRGQIPSDAVEQVETAVKNGIPVVLTTRCSDGTVKGVYDYKGSGRDLERMGVIMGGDLTSSKARIKLILALSNNYTLDQIRTVFND